MSVAFSEDFSCRTQQQKVDVYMDDMPLLEYALARYDDTCNVRFAGKGFGSDGYAFGLPRFSWLKKMAASVCSAL
ncbi:hypothetical protein RRG08_023526 [Elysia crispata]|uniref:Uncharacterized protein n=1 Tax=Elysia crispata TaxID=231223 RepID=A0AAE0YY39_9GAST|nr:hypothetical protein RRG08_023526 [Elysia crispata]